ncbi:MAG: hypothetical protein IT198_13635 [Acidimicrobiia bacterium]|nr:hypothetical protein [Acidimicrobiia bacterium]
MATEPDVALADAAHAHVLLSGDTDRTGLADPRPPVRTPRVLVEVLDRIENA